MTDLAAKIVAIHQSLAAAQAPHGFGGALALAWCTESARATIDIDVNVFVDHTKAASVLAVLPSEVVASAEDLHLLLDDGQARLWWDTTPVDLFLDTTEFHRQAARRCPIRPFAGYDIPFLACDDLAVFKAFFNRTRDWADLEAMVAVGALDPDRVIGVLVRYLGADDPRISRLQELTV